MITDWSPEIVRVATAISWVVISLGLLLAFVNLAQLVLAARALATRPPVANAALLWRRYSEVAPPIALIVPAYNEELNIVESVRSMLALEYPLFEVIVVNDGSKDETLARLIAAYDMKLVSPPYEDRLAHQPIRGIYASPMNRRLFVVDKANGGKADAQNAGINLCRAPIFCVIDGDSVLEPDALMRAAQPFIDDPSRVIAVDGTIRVANGSIIENGRVTRIGLPTRLLPLLQVVEYLRAFLIARLAWSRINTLMLVSGAFGVFRRAEVVAAGGFTAGSMGEDLDLIIKLHRLMRDSGRDYRIAFIPEPVCWTEAPESLSVLGKQRSRWQRGALESFFRYKSMLFRPRYGRIGFLGMGHILVVDVLTPVAEVLGYILMPLFWILGIISWQYLLAFTGLFFTFGVAVSVGSLILDEAELKRFPRARDLAILTFAAIIENFGYRQLNSYWRIKGYWQFLRKDNSWGEMTRTGFSKKKP